MIAGPTGRGPTFFFASAIVAKYDRLACNLLIHSAYSCVAGFPPPGFAASTGLLPSALGSVEVGEFGDCCG